MNCPRCGKIISESTLTCPYCKSPIKEDYFGYMQSSRNANEVQYGTKKNSSSKVVFIVLGVVFSFIALSGVLFLALFSSGNKSAEPEYDGNFNISTSFVLSVTDEAYSDAFTVCIIPIADNSGNQNNTYMDSYLQGETISYSLSEGEYNLVIIKSGSDMINLKMTVTQACQYNTVNINYGERQIETTNGMSL